MSALCYAFQYPDVGAFLPARNKLPPPGNQHHVQVRSPALFDTTESFAAGYLLDDRLARSKSREVNRWNRSSSNRIFGLRFGGTDV